MTRALLAGLPYAVMAAVVVVDFASDPGLTYLPLVSLGPAFAAVGASVRGSVVIGGVAVVLCEVLAVYNHLLGSRRNYLAILTVVGVTVASALASAGLRRRERALASVRIVAEVAQGILLPPPPPVVGPLRVAARYISASADASIGGDLYEVAATPYGVRLVMGDVKGKGLPAVEMAATVLSTFRYAAYDTPSLVRLADRLEGAVSGRLTAEGFVTAVLVEVDPDRDELTLVACGHPPPIHITGTAARFLPYAEGDLPLGLAALDRTTRSARSAAFAPGDRILFYTDGISEARDGDGAFFPLLDHSRRLATGDPPDALDRLHASVIDHVGRSLDDDAAMLLVERTAD